MFEAHDFRVKYLGVLTVGVKEVRCKKAKRGYSEKQRWFRTLCQKFRFGFPKIIPVAIFQNVWFNGSHFVNVTSFRFSGNFRKKHSYHLPQFASVCLVPFASVSKGVELLVELNTPERNWGDDYLLIDLLAYVHLYISDVFLFVCRFWSTFYTTKIRVLGNRRESIQRKSFMRTIGPHLVRLFLTKVWRRPNYIRILLKVNLAIPSLNWPTFIDLA